MIQGYFFLLFFIVNIGCSLFGFKLVGLVPVRNESIMIGQCLKALSKFTDAIIVLDDCSDDATVSLVESLAQECNVVKIITKNSWFRNEPDDKNKLLHAGREAGGTHFIVIDADEMLTANFLKNNMLRSAIERLRPGDTLSLCWIQLWRSVDTYRFDNSVWTWSYKTIAFADNGTAQYSSGFIHTAPVPSGLRGKKMRIRGYEYGLLHFQFVNWNNLLIKQAWYRCLERIRYTHKSDKEINKIYAPSKNERNLRLACSKETWFSGYPFFDSSLFNQPEEWRTKQVVAWFSQYGKDYFKNLDIWDIDWGIN